MAISSNLSGCLWNIAFASAVAAATLPPVPAVAAGVFPLPVQIAENDESELDVAPDEGAELRRPLPQPDTPSQDGTDNGLERLPPGDDGPEPFGGCIFEKRPLELLV